MDDLVYTSQAKQLWLSLFLVNGIIGSILVYTCSMLHLMHVQPDMLANVSYSIAIIHIYVNSYTKLICMCICTSSIHIANAMC